MHAYTNVCTHVCTCLSVISYIACVSLCIFTGTQTSRLDTHTHTQAHITYLGGLPKKQIYIPVCL